MKPVPPVPPLPPRVRPITPLIERIAAKILAPPDPASPLPGFPFVQEACWLWTGAHSLKRSGTRRPIVKVNSATNLVLSTLRVMLSLKDGVPLELRTGLEACHKRNCPNISCVNPFHAYWGTPEQNVNDRYRKDG
jgi:hypothetical protein